MIRYDPTLVDLTCNFFVLCTLWVEEKVNSVCLTTTDHVNEVLLHIDLSRYIAIF